MRADARRARARHDAHQAHGGGSHRLPATQLGVRVRYLHSDIDALERVEILRGLARRASSTCWSGINLLREGLDLPEVSLVAVLRRGQEGFLRSERSLIQTVRPRGAARRTAASSSTPIR